MASDRRMECREFRRKRISAVDLFCGVGGLTHGFILEGIKVNAGIDIDPWCKYPYERNNGSRFIRKDVRILTGNELANLYPPGDIKVLAGCAPCQPFSTYTQRYDTDEDSDLDLLLSFGRLVDQVRPDIVTMENVCRISRHEIYGVFLQVLAQLDYWVESGDVECLGFGVPQTRKRLVLLASKYGPIKMIPYTHGLGQYRTVRNTIGNLKPLKAGETAEDDPLHKASSLSYVNLKRIKASKPGASWRDWERDLIADCHKKDSGETYPGVYGRMQWDKPAPTLTTQFYGFGNGRFGHPKQDRAISLREGALLQTFPKHYGFAELGKPIHFKRIGRLIGNAVPVRLGVIIARSIKRHLEKYRENLE